jgi:hypothetical protein
MATLQEVQEQHQRALQEEAARIQAACDSLGVRVVMVDLSLTGSNVYVKVNINDGGYNRLENEYYKNWTFQQRDDQGRLVGWYLCGMDGEVANIQNIVASMVEDNISIHRVVVSPHPISKLLKENKI